MLASRITRTGDLLLNTLNQLNIARVAIVLTTISSTLIKKSSDQNGCELIKKFSPTFPSYSIYIPTISIESIKLMSHKL